VYDLIAQPVVIEGFPVEPFEQTTEEYSLRNAVIVTDHGL
jgi:hypothetical protein